MMCENCKKEMGDSYFKELEEHYAQRGDRLMSVDPLLERTELSELKKFMWFDLIVMNKLGKKEEIQTILCPCGKINSFSKSWWKKGNKEFVKFKCGNCNQEETLELGAIDSLMGAGR